MPLQHADRHEPFLAALLAGDRREAFSLVSQLQAEGMPMRDIYLSVFQPALCEIGSLWEHSRIGVANERLATALIQTAMSRVYTDGFRAAAKDAPVLVAACTENEQHDIGLRMVADLLEEDGWDTYFFGANLPISEIAPAVAERKPNAVALSATMQENVPNLAKMIRAVRSVDPDTVVVVGGHPFLVDPDLASALGADLTAADAGEITPSLRAAVGL